MPSKGSPSKKLQRQIRLMPEYKEWREEVLKKDCRNYPNHSKRTQIHHVKSFSQLLKDYNITSVDEARECKELWNIDLGQALQRGEHSIWTQICRYKTVSKNFVDNIKGWLEEHKNDDRKI